MPALHPLSVEIDDQLPILKIRDINGYELRYLLGEDGQLQLGRVWVAIAKSSGHRVTLFLPAGLDTPTVLKVEQET